MKKKLVIAISCAILASFMTLGYNKTTPDARLLANLDALANPEDDNGGGGDGGGTNPGGGGTTPGEEGTMANACCPIRNVSIVTETTLTGPKVTISCNTGGKYKCHDCTCN